MKKKESKYKVGDRIKIRSREWYDLHKDINGNVCAGCEWIFNPCTALVCGRVLTISRINSLGWYEVEEEAVFIHEGMCFKGYDIGGRIGIVFEQCEGYC